MNIDEMWEDVRQAESIQVKNDTSVMLRVKKLMGKFFLKDLEEYLYYCDSTYNFSITNKKPDDELKQMEGEYSKIKYAYVYQRSEGTEGDSWSGMVHIYLKRGMYFKFNYSM